MVPWDHPSPQPKWRLAQFMCSRFHQCDRLTERPRYSVGNNRLHLHTQYGRCSLKLKYGYITFTATEPLPQTHPLLRPSMRLQSSVLSAVSWHPPPSGSHQPHAGMLLDRSHSIDPSYPHNQNPNLAERIHPALCPVLCTWQ